MAKTDFRGVDDYIAAFPKDIRNILETVRRTVLKAVPDAEEVISYQVPAFKSHGWVLYVAVHKNHYSILCPPPRTVFTALKRELAPYKTSKSAIQFPLDKPVPVALIRRIAQFRAKENLQRENKKK